MKSEVTQYLLWNPVMHALEISRGLYFIGYRPTPHANAMFVAAFGLLALAFGLSLYRVRRERLVAI